MKNRDQAASLFPAKLPAHCRHERPRAITNDVTPAQLAIQPGDPVVYLRDDGTATHHVARSVVDQIGGTLVVWLNGVSGCVALCRVTPAEVT